MIDLKLAERRARQYVGAVDDLVSCSERPEGLYLVHPVDEYYFAAIPTTVDRIGAGRIVAVNTLTGAVREAGSSGE